MAPRLKMLNEAPTTDLCNKKRSPKECKRGMVGRLDYSASPRRSPVSKRLLGAFRAKNDFLILSTFQWWKILHSFLHECFNPFKWVDGQKH
jgi:hypothetical protein